ncbi:MAG: sulfurtransferase TusA family protein [Deltaproteobacteria bacterium]|nr:sulfurtransferase TusA family protein [Deltaproteobacteria bacterium]
MATVKLDATGLRCPQPILKIASKMPELNSGDILEVLADCTTFEDDVRKWCQRMQKTLLAITIQGDSKIAQIKF